MELVNFYGKEIQIYHIHVQAISLKVTLCKAMSKSIKKLKVKIQDSMGKTNFFFGTLPCRPWAILATWLCIGAPQKKYRNMNL
jgi:hypothetical protein